MGPWSFYIFVFHSQLVIHDEWAYVDTVKPRLIRYMQYLFDPLDHLTNTIQRYDLALFLYLAPNMGLHCLTFMERNLDNRNKLMPIKTMNSVVMNSIMMNNLSYE